MRRESILLYIVVILASSALIRTVTAPPLPPCAFYGYVYVGGEPAQDGLNITALIEGTTLKWTTETKNGTYGWPAKGSSLPDGFWIPSDDPETSEKDGGIDGNRIAFYVEGNKTDQTAVFASGSAVEFDLSILPDDQNVQSEFDVRVLYAASVIVVIGVGSVAAFWMRRKGYKLKVLKPK